MLDNKNRFVINNYHKKGIFCNFLPGISGEKGIPIWCHYMNRGQAIACFGSEDKDHSIMQFYPAHQASIHTKTLGFRTFIKKDGEVFEAFSEPDNEQNMYIGMNELKIEEIDKEHEVKVTVHYFTLPEESLGGLIRHVTIANLSDKEVSLEILDGMPAIVPFGVTLTSINEMGQTSKAWMQVVNLETKAPVFNLRASMQDSAEVQEITGGNFGFALSDKGELLTPFVEAAVLFEYDTAFLKPRAFMEQNLDGLYTKKQMAQNNMPSCIFGNKITLPAGAEEGFYEIYGFTGSIDSLGDFVEKCQTQDYFEKKYERALTLTEQITDYIGTKTADSTFDLYCRQTYLDNVLRGGMPIRLGNDNKVFYVYSRKHGDMERDYNYFRMSGEFYSQGNGNFRDVNQNRRCDVSFAPFVQTRNIKQFYNAIQINGYNPLGIEKITYYLEDEDINTVAEGKDENAKAELKAFLSKSFTPGKLYDILAKYDMTASFDQIMEKAVDEEKTDFIEGYWTDHFTYNLDLVEDYLSIFPEKQKELLFDDKTYNYAESPASVLPRSKRYRVTDKGIRQYAFLDEKESDKRLLTDKDGKVVHSSLMEKMVLLCVLKFAALDRYGMGVEMEGGKPGWYDALNGLPGLLGSSMSETYELSRCLRYAIDMLNTYDENIELFEELGGLLDDIVKIVAAHKDEIATKDCVIAYYDEINDRKEAYTQAVKDTVTGTKVAYKSADLAKALSDLYEVVSCGIKKAVKFGDGLCPTYFYYTVTDYEQTNDGIIVKAVDLEKVPFFLEGPVRYLKLDVSKDEKKKIYDKVRSSKLYDEKLKMYKVNAALSEATIEVGRARAFTPGWLENESIWLHMEYKYLLELLKSELYEEYLDDFAKALIPFQKEEVYGRSLLENSSFIASSANPDESIHGKGFVARLSGSTVEFIHMWKIMMFGKTPFTQENGELKLAFTPLVPAGFIGEDKTITVNFLGKTKVVYHFNEKKDYIPGQYECKKYQVVLPDGVVEAQGAFVGGKIAQSIRNHEATRIDVYVE